MDRETVKRIGHLANVVLRPLVGIICGYEPLTLLPDRLYQWLGIPHPPSVSKLSHRWRKISAVVLIGLAMHFYWPQTDEEWDSLIRAVNRVTGGRVQ